MTQNIEQRTEVAVKKYEGASNTVEKIAHTDSTVNTPTGDRKSFPKISREWDDESQRLQKGWGDESNRLQAEWQNDSSAIREDWQNERNELSTKALGVKAWESGQTETNINQQRRWSDNHTYLPKTVPAVMDAGGPDDNWIPYTADKSDTLNDVFGRKPVDLTVGLVLAPDVKFNYPKLNANGKVWELDDSDQQLTVKSFSETADEHLIITLNDDSQVVANKAYGATRTYVSREEVFRQQELTETKILSLKSSKVTGAVVDGYTGIRINNLDQNNNKLWYAWDKLPKGEIASFIDNNDYGTATLTNTEGESFTFLTKRRYELRLRMHVDGWGAASDGVISEPSLIAASLNENLEPITNQDAHDNKDAFKAAFEYWLSQPTQFKGALNFSRGSYKTTEPWYFKDQPTIFGELLGDGQTIIDFDFTEKAYKNMVEWISCRELKATNLWLRYLPETNLPECGLLKARYAITPTTDRFSGRHRYSNFRITGKFTISAYYNYATEEQYYENIQFRNFNKDLITGSGIGHAVVITAHNLHGVSSEYTTIIDYKQSTTIFNMQNPKFEQAGEDDHSVSFLFAGGTGLNIVGGYIQSNGLASLMLDSSNGSCGNVTIMSTQLEQSNKDTSDPNYKNFNYSIVLKANTESTPYAASSHIGITVIGLAEFGEKSMLIDTGKIVEKCSFNFSRKVESVHSGAITTIIKSTKFLCSQGVDLTKTKTLTDVAITCDKWEDIKIPQNRANTVTLTAQDAPYFEGDTEDTRNSVDGVMTALYGNIMVGNPSAPIKSVVLGSGQPIHGMEIKLCSGSTAAITLQHNAVDGNIYTSTGSDLTPAWYEHVLLRWNRRAGKFVASIM